jgi:hypothetical protein
VLINRFVFLMTVIPVLSICVKMEFVFTPTLAAATQI